MADAIEDIEEVSGKQKDVVEDTITKTDTKIEAWFVQHFHGVSEMTTNVFNRAHAAKEELKKILKEV